MIAEGMYAKFGTSRIYFGMNKFLRRNDLMCICVSMTLYSRVSRLWVRMLVMNQQLQQPDESAFNSTTIFYSFYVI